MSDGFQNPSEDFQPQQKPVAPPPGPPQGFPPQQGIPQQGPPWQGLPQQGAYQSGFPPNGGSLQSGPGQRFGSAPVDNKKISSGILAILFGYFGVHKFFLGYTTEGIIQLFASLFTCGLAGIIPLIEGIIYLTKSDEDFYYTYQVNKKGWF